MDSESSAVRLRRKLSELSREYSKDKQGQTRSKSANNRSPVSDLNASFRYRRMKRKVDALRTQIDVAMHDNYLSADDLSNSEKPILSAHNHDDQHLVTSELIQVLYSKQKRIDELEQRLKQVEQQESQWKMKYERECNRCEVLQTRIIELEQELLNRKRQSKILGQLQSDVKRLHTAFDALEVENTQLNAQLSLNRNPHLAEKLKTFRNELAHKCPESLC